MGETEIRGFGDGQTIVVYTENNKLYRRLKGWQACQRVVLYEAGNIVVAADLYFPKKSERELRKALV